MQLTLGTAQITRQGNVFVLRYMGHGSFTIGERTYGKEESAREFCAERDLRVVGWPS